MPSYAVIGASRGIGLEFVRQLAARPDATVIAVVRSPAGSTHLNAAIAGLRNVHVVAADVTDYASLEHAANDTSHITDGKLDVLIHNAAHMNTVGFDDFANMEELDAEFISAFKVNALGPVHAITAFLPLLRAAYTKKIVVVGTGGAEPKFIRAIESANMAAYGMTKAAALIATTKFAVKLKDEGFIVISLSPGLVDTSGTIGESGNADVSAMYEASAVMWRNKYGLNVEVSSPEASVAMQLETIDKLKPADNGLFLARDGVEWAIPSK